VNRPSFALTILGSPILIEWSKLTPGASFFIPCLDRTAMRRMIAAEAARLKIQVVMKSTVENKMYGLRVWRLPDRIDP